MELKIFGRAIHIPLNGLNVSRRLEFRLLMRYLDLDGEERLLDVACGDGYWSNRMTSRAAAVVGFDFNQNRLRQARKLAKFLSGAIRCDAHDLPIKSAAFDCSVGICVLEHFKDDLKALRELRRVLKPGGKLALTVDSFTYPGFSQAKKAKHAEKFSVAHFYDINSLRDRLKEAGFEVVEWSYLLRTPISARLYQWALRFPKLAYFFFPLAYPLSLWSERLSKNQTGGYKLAVAARAQ